MTEDANYLHGLDEKMSGSQQVTVAPRNFPEFLSSILTLSGISALENADPRFRFQVCLPGRYFVSVTAGFILRSLALIFQPHATHCRREYP